MTCGGHSLSKWRRGDLPRGPSHTKAQVITWAGLSNVEAQKGTRPSASFSLLSPRTARQSSHRQRWQQRCVWQTHLGSFQGHKSLLSR